MKPLLFLIIAVTMCACSSITGTAMKKLHPGMTKEQALKITGQSDGYKTNGNTEVYTFTDRPIDMNSPNRADYQMTFVDGKLSSWGAESVRKSNIGVVGVFGNVNVN